MLETLDDISWNELRESFGYPATDVPRYIRNLLSPSEKDRSDAIDSLRYRICNEHMLHTATLATMPFLISLLKHEATQDKHNILYLVTDCYTHYDIDIMSEVTTQSSRVQLEVKISEVILDSMDTYFELLSHDDWKVRRAIIEFIGKEPFPRHMWQQIEEHYQDFKAKETHPDIQKLFPKLDEYRLKYFATSSDN